LPEKYFEVAGRGARDQRGKIAQRADLRHARAAGLLRRPERDAPPTLGAPRRRLALPLRHGAVADERDDRRDAELGRLLDDEVELVPFAERLRQRDRERRFALGTIRAIERDLRDAAGVRCDRSLVLEAF